MRRTLHRATGLVAGLMLALALPGCGGGLVIGIGVGGGNDPPSITLSAGADSAPRNTVLRLFADASDDDGVSLVRFFRVEDDGDSVELASDSGRPFQFDVTLPASGRARYFARAVDTDGETTDSATIEITLTAATN